MTALSPVSRRRHLPAVTAAEPVDGAVTNAISSLVTFASHQSLIGYHRAECGRGRGGTARVDTTEGQDR